MVSPNYAPWDRLVDYQRGVNICELDLFWGFQMGKLRNYLEEHQYLIKTEKCYVTCDLIIPLGVA